MKDITELLKCYKNDPIDKPYNEELKRNKDKLKRYTNASIDVFESYLEMSSINSFNVGAYLTEMDKYEYNNIYIESDWGPRVYTRDQFYHHCLKILLRKKYGDITLDDILSYFPQEDQQILAKLFNEQTLLEKMFDKITKNK